MKLFLHEMLPRSVGKTIYVDTDAFFVSDPSLLWNAFSRMNETTAISMGSHPDQVSPEWNHASRICSCVMLLDLDKLRSSRLMHSSLYQQAEGPDYQPALSHPAFKAMYGLPGGDGKGRYDNVRLGDQGYWWAIIQFYPQLFTPLPFDYEVTSCLMDTYMTGLGDDMRSEEEEMKKQIHVEGTPQEVWLSSQRSQSPPDADGNFAGNNYSSQVTSLVCARCTPSFGITVLNVSPATVCQTFIWIGRDGKTPTTDSTSDGARHLLITQGTNGSGSTKETRTSQVIDLRFPQSPTCHLRTNGFFTSQAANEFGKLTRGRGGLCHSSLANYLSLVSRTNVME